MTTALLFIEMDSKIYRVVLENPRIEVERSGAEIVPKLILTADGSSDIDSVSTISPEMFSFISDLREVEPL